MPIKIKQTDYYDNEKEYEISLFNLIKAESQENGKIESIESKIFSLYVMFEEFLESTKEGREYLKKRVEYSYIGNLRYVESKEES